MHPKNVPKSNKQNSSDTNTIGKNISIGIFSLFLCLAAACQGDMKTMNTTNTKTTAPVSVTAPQPKNTPMGKQNLKAPTLTNTPFANSTLSPLNDVFWAIEIGQNSEE